MVVGSGGIDEKVIISVETFVIKRKSRLASKSFITDLEKKQNRVRRLHWRQSWGPQALRKSRCESLRAQLVAMKVKKFKNWRRIRFVGDDVKSWGVDLHVFVAHDFLERLVFHLLAHAEEDDGALDDELVVRQSFFLLKQCLHHSAVSDCLVALFCCLKSDYNLSGAFQTLSSNLNVDLVQPMQNFITFKSGPHHPFYLP